MLRPRYPTVLRFLEAAAPIGQCAERVPLGGVALIGSSPEPSIAAMGACRGGCPHGRAGMVPRRVEQVSRALGN